MNRTTTTSPTEAERFAALKSQLALLGCLLYRVTDLIEDTQTFMAVRNKAAYLLPELDDVQHFLVLKGCAR